MKIPFSLLIFLFLISCKSEDGKIVFEFPKDTKMKFEEFNESNDQMGSGIIYIGKPVKSLPVKYYDKLYSEVTAPPPPKGYLDQKTILKEKKRQDSAQQARKPYFYSEEISQITRVAKIDTTFFNNENLKIRVLKDTIPIYRYHYEKGEINSYKAFPVVLKNISKKSIEIPTNFFWKSLYMYDGKNHWKLVRNGNRPLSGCFIMPFVQAIRLPPGEIIAYAIPYFKSGKKYKTRVGLSGAYSEVFDLEINAETISGPRDGLF